MPHIYIVASVLNYCGWENKYLLCQENDPNSCRLGGKFNVFYEGHYWVNCYLGHAQWYDWTLSCIEQTYFSAKSATRTHNIGGMFIFEWWNWSDRHLALNRWLENSLTSSTSFDPSYLDVTIAVTNLSTTTFCCIGFFWPSLFFPLSLLFYIFYICHPWSSRRIWWSLLFLAESLQR